MNRYMPEIKQCPFCGGEAVLLQSGKHFNKVWFRVVCKNDCCEQMYQYDNTDEAIEAWNRRANDENAG